MKRLPVFFSFVFFMALCISATFWAMRLFKPPVRPVVAPSPIARVEINMVAATSLFGGRPAAAAVASNFQLRGVIVADNPVDSAAILSADGKPPQSVALNQEVMPGVTVKEVHAQYVLLSEGGITKRVDLLEAGSQLRVDVMNADTAPPPIMPPPAQQMMPPSTMPAPQMGRPNGLMRLPVPIGGAGGG